MWLAKTRFERSRAVIQVSFAASQVVSPDPRDGKFAHLDGLNLSRAWMLGGLARTLDNPQLGALAEMHAAAGLAAVTGEHYEGGHWLGTFAVYLLTNNVTMIGG